MGLLALVAFFTAAALQPLAGASYYLPQLLLALLVGGLLTATLLNRVWHGTHPVTIRYHRRLSR